MTRDELKALQVASSTIKNAGHLLRALAEFPPVEAGGEGSPREAREEAGKQAHALARNTLRILAERSLSELQEARPIVEAHAASGIAFPALANDLLSLLEAGRPEWLSYLTSTEAAKWEAEARAIQAAAGRSFAGLKEGGDPPTYPHIYTTKSDAALREIFSKLVKKGFIAGTDEGGSAMLEAFLAAFEMAPKQSGGIVWSDKPGGRIIWTKTARSRKTNKAALLDFLYLNGAGKWEDWISISAAVFGIEFNKSDKRRYANDTSGIYSSACHEELEQLLR